MSGRSREQVITHLLANTRRTPAGCLVWTGKRTDNGYVRLHWNGRYWLGHRLLFELTKSTVPNGMQLDHVCHTLDARCAGGRLCEHRACLDVAHLDVVTIAENVSRGAPTRSRCRKGHLRQQRGPEGRCPACYSSKKAKQLIRERSGRAARRAAA